MKNFVNKGSGTLKVDFMLIGSKGNDFVYPYSPIYNPSTKRYENCLVLMFIVYELEGKDYPIMFDYWVSEVYYEEFEKYLNKNEIFIQAIEYLIKIGIKIELIIKDSGFFKKDVIEFLDKKNIFIVTRCPKNHKIKVKEVSENVHKYFSEKYNGEYYFYNKTNSFLKKEEVEVLGIEGSIVAIAKNKEKLLNKELIFLFTNNRNLTLTQVQKIYKTRWSIEVFFKILKSYLSLSVFHRNNYEYVDELINLSLCGYIILLEISKKLNLKITQVLKKIKSGELLELFNQVFYSSSNYLYCCV